MCGTSPAPTRRAWRCHDGLGLRLSIAEKHSGANLIAITGLGGIDLPSGTAAFNGVRFQVRALDAMAPAQRETAAAWAARNETLSILPTAFLGMASTTKNEVGRL